MSDLKPVGYTFTKTHYAKDRKDTSIYDYEYTYKVIGYMRVFRSSMDKVGYLIEEIERLDGKKEILPEGIELVE